MTIPGYARGTAGRRPVRGSLPTLSLLQRSYPTSGFNIYTFLSLACIPVLPQKRQSLERAQAPANRSLFWCDDICSSRLAEGVWEMQKVEVLWSQVRQQPAQPRPALPSCFSMGTPCYTFWLCLLQHFKLQCHVQPPLKDVF